LGFGLVKVGLVAFILVSGVLMKWDMILATGGMSVEHLGQFIWQVTVELVKKTAFALAVLAILDYGFQKWKYEQDLKMTDEEIREEVKSTQGDPMIKSRRRRVQRQLAQQRLQNDIPKADVIVTNPTELAIAIQYDPLTMKAPVVVAKGADLVAARIRKIALEHSIPVVERKPLAQALFKAVKIGQPIPTTEYGAVAEVLKYVYELKGKKMPDLRSRTQND
jgi:flagellar biosynthetic protein FlhB